MDTAQSGWYSSPAASAADGQIQVLSVVKSGAAASSYLNGASQGTNTVPEAMLTPMAALAVAIAPAAITGITVRLRRCSSTIVRSLMSSVSNWKPR